MKTDKVAITSENIQNENLQKLRGIFPNFVKDGQVDFDGLQAFLKKDGILAGGEKYGLNWSGKSNAFGAIRTTAAGTFIPQRQESKNWDETENIFIEGDNLEVLKLLQKHYREKIKMIYIDPPYNTGKDFVYKDNFTQGVADYYEQTGQTKDGIKMTANTEKNGRYHSDWLTMMYPRLFLARNLLKEDGVIFISIDDNEVANLRFIMDEIFGEENFVAQIVWQKKYTGGKHASFYVDLHEYILVYARTINNLNSILIDRPEDEKEKFEYEDEYLNERGKYYIRPLKSNLEERKTLVYPIMLPDGNKIETQWLVAKDTFEKMNQDGRILFKQKQNGEYQVYKKYYEKDGEGKVMVPSLITGIYNTEAKIELKQLFGNLEGRDTFFDTPKPSKLIKYLSKPILKYDDIIMDFFAGSGTTAHAVMDLNAEDNGDRKFICVQLPEVIGEDSEAYKAGYKTISEISRERIRRAGEKIGKGDVGFKSYKLSSSNYRQWQNLTEQNESEDIINQSKLFLEKPLVDNYKETDVVYEILVKEGFDLNTLIESKIIPSVIEFYRAMDPVTSQIIYISFVDKISKKMIDEINMEQSATFVCLDSALDDTVKMNIGKSLIIKTI